MALWHHHHSEKQRRRQTRRKWRRKIWKFLWWSFFSFFRSFSKVLFFVDHRRNSRHSFSNTSELIFSFNFTLSDDDDATHTYFSRNFRLLLSLLPEFRVYFLLNYLCSDCGARASESWSFFSSNFSYVSVCVRVLFSPFHSSHCSTHEIYGGSAYVPFQQQQQPGRENRTNDDDQVMLFLTCCGCVFFVQAPFVCQWNRKTFDFLAMRAPSYGSAELLLELSRALHVS